MRTPPLAWGQSHCREEMNQLLTLPEVLQVKGSSDLSMPPV